MVLLAKPGRIFDSRTDQKPVFNFAPRRKLWPQVGNFGPPWGTLAPRGELWPPSGELLATRGEVIPWGAETLCLPSIFLKSRECSPRG
jgi:hypothetical protein